MIHSEHFMYENILAANWTANKFKNLFIIGNNFRNYRRSISTLPTQEYFHLQMFASRCCVKELNIPIESYAFSDTCLNYYNDLSDKSYLE